MICSIEQLIEDVMSRMGETSEVSPSAGLTGVPTLEDILKRKISSFLPEVGKKLLVEASAEMLAGAEDYHVEVSARKVPAGLYAVDIPLPEDFVRLVSLKMRSWQRSVEKVFTPGSDGFQRQYSAEPGISGCPLCPQAYLSNGILSAIGSETASDTLEHLHLWRIPTPDSAGNFHFPAPLYPDLLSHLINN
ncbi:MAG: hypothetical protein NC095_00370 [Muribaculum sp.]|nr:hypothetical protein [Muribaculum sp.]